MHACRHLLAAAAMLSAASVSSAKTPCPPHVPGEPYPWEQGNDQVQPGDRWAWMYIDIDKTGRPLQCKMGENNIPEDDRFGVCNAFLQDWHGEPEIKDGVPVRSTVKRFVMMRGSQHQKAADAARKKFFREHPDERPSCYPE
jgi:hypothetical protein